MSKPEDCQQPENVVCPMSSNGWNEYKRLVLSSMDGLKDSIKDLREENRNEHDLIFGKLGDAKAVNVERFAALEKQSSFSRGQVTAWVAVVAIIVSVVVGVILNRL